MQEKTAEDRLGSISRAADDDHGVGEEGLEDEEEDQSKDSKPSFSGKS